MKKIILSTLVGMLVGVVISGYVTEKRLYTTLTTPRDNSIYNVTIDGEERSYTFKEVNDILAVSLYHSLPAKQ